MPNLRNPKTGEEIELPYDESGMAEADRLKREGWVSETTMYKKIKATGNVPYKMKGSYYKKKYKKQGKTLNQVINLK